MIQNDQCKMEISGKCFVKRPREIEALRVIDSLKGREAGIRWQRFTIEYMCTYMFKMLFM